MNNPAPEESTGMSEKELREKQEADTFYDISNMASMSECTGLIPAAVENEEESAAYGELYAIHKPEPVSEETAAKS